MKNCLRLYLAVMLALILLCATEASATAVIYPAPPGAILSRDYIVKVNGQAVSVYSFLNQNKRYSFAYFDFSGTVQVDVTMATPWMRTPIIRPTSKGIGYTLNGTTITFSLSNPANLSIEPDSGSIIDATPLLLFANPLEVNAPRPGDLGVIYYGPGNNPQPPSGPGTIYYGPGIHTLPTGGLNVTSNQTIYIAGGAIVTGYVRATNASNVKIRGRGILDGLGVNGMNGSTGGKMLMILERCANVSVEGIILKDSQAWTLWILASSYVAVNNLKIVSAVGPVWHDGIDINNSNHVTIQDSFILTDDDTFQIGGQFAGPAVDTISAARCALWANANNWRIAWVAQAPYISTLTFTDIDVLHRASYYRVVTVEASGNGTVGTPVTNLRFENIRIDADYGWRGDFIELRPQVWGTDGAIGPPGKIQNVYFKNIYLSGYQNPTTLGALLISGPAADQYVRDVTFENVVRYGQVATATSPNISISGYTSNMRFVGGTPSIPPPDTQAPSIPENPRAQAASSSQINLTWNASTDTVGVTGYRIFRSGAQIGIATGTACSNTGLSASTAYSYTVAAYDAAGNASGQSAAASTTTHAAATGAVGTVSNLSAAAAGANSVTLSFTEVTDGAGQPAKYDVRFSSSGALWGGARSVTQGTCATPLAGTTVGATKTCTVLGLPPSTAYQFQLIAFRGTIGAGAVYGALSNLAGASTSSAANVMPPAKPRNLRAQ